MKEGGCDPNVELPQIQNNFYGLPLSELAPISLSEEPPDDDDEVPDDDDDEPLEVGASKSGKPKIGSCIGVLYSCKNKPQDGDFCTKCGTRYYCIHNGRLVKDTKTYILVNHYAPGKNSPYEETRKFYKINKSPHVVRYKRTPDLTKGQPHYCETARSTKTDAIKPGQCVGIEYYDTAKNIYDVKNGRFLYWTNKKGDSFCILHASDPVFEVFYYHYETPTCKDKKPNSTPKITSKPWVKKVYKLTRTNHGPVAKC